MRKNSRKEQISRAVFVRTFCICLFLLAIFLGIDLVKLSFPRIEIENVETHKNLFFADPDSNIVLGVSITRFKELSKFARFDIDYAISDLGEIYLDQNLFDTVDVFTPTGDLKQVIRNEDLHGHHSLYFDLDHCAIYATHFRYPLNPNNLNPTHYAITKYSTLTNSTEYSFPRWNIFSRFLNSYTKINGTEYRFKYIKGFTPDGNALISAEEMIEGKKQELQTEGGTEVYYPRVEISIPRLYFIEGELTVQNIKNSAGGLIGFDGKGNRYNLISENTITKVESNGSTEEFSTNWTSNEGKILGVDREGNFYYLKYNENSGPATFLKYNSSLELVSTIEISIPYNDLGYMGGYMGEEELTEAIWGQAFLSKDGTIYYSFIEPEKDLWYIKKYTFPDNVSTQTTNLEQL